MRTLLNSTVWFVSGTVIMVIVACILCSLAGQGTTALGFLFFGPFMLTLGTAAFFVIAKIALRHTTDGRHNVLSLVTGLLYPLGLYGLLTLFGDLVPSTVSNTLQLVGVFVLSLLCQGILFGAAWLVLYGPQYYRERLAPPD